MDPKTPTNFIPRSSTTDATLPPRAPAGILTVTAVLIFAVVIVGTAGVFFYKYTLEKKATTLQTELETYNKKVRDPEVGKILALNNRLNTAMGRLGAHSAVSNVIDTLAKETLQDVRWNNFNFSSGEAGGVALTLGGQARNFSAVALQADRLSSEANATNFRNVMFSNMTLDNNGNPIFTVKMQLLPSVLSFALPKVEPVVTP